MRCKNRRAELRWRNLQPFIRATNRRINSSIKHGLQTMEQRAKDTILVNQFIDFVDWRNKPDCYEIA